MWGGGREGGEGEGMVDGAWREGWGGGGRDGYRSLVARIRRCVARGSVSEVFPDYQ